MKYHLIFSILVLLTACRRNNNNIDHFSKQMSFKAYSLCSKENRTPIGLTVIEKTFIKCGLIDIQTLDPDIKVELKYSGTDNYFKRNFYGSLKKAYFHVDVAKKLVKAQQKLKELHPGYSLVIYDAARPMYVQYEIWKSVEAPPGEKGKYASNPLNGGSLHNYGAAVDLNIIDSTGSETDMGCCFDYFGELAYPCKEDSLLAEGLLTTEQINNRKLLRSVMRYAGFFGIPTEWWHFNSCRRQTAMEIYKIIE